MNSKTTNILGICNKVKDVKRFLLKNDHASSNIKIASDSIKVHQFIKQNHSQIECIFIDKAQQSLHNADAMDFIAQLNEVFKQSIPDYDKLIYLNTKFDGGVTSHEIHQAFNLIEIYFDLINLQFDYIYIFFSPETYSECKIVSQICEQYNIPYRAYNESRFISNFKFKKYKVKNKLIEIFIPYRLFLLLYKILVIAIIIRNKYEKCQSFMTKDNDEVLFLIKIRENRFISEYENVIHEIQRKSNKINCKLLLYLSSNHKVTINTNFEYVERYLSLKDYLTIMKTLKIVKRSFNPINKFVMNMKHKDIRLDKLIKFEYFLNIELLQTYLLKQGTCNYLRLHKPVAIKMWGDNQTEWTKIVKGYYLSQKNAPLFFTWFQDGFAHKYMDFQGFDILFCASSSQISKFDQHVSIRKVLISPLKKEMIVKGASRREKIEKNKVLKNILFAVGYVAKGQYTIYEVVNIIEVLQKLISYYDIKIQIKCHPSQARELIDDILNVVGISDKIMVLDSKMNINTLLPEADIIISPFSTVIYESSVIGKPTVLTCFGSLESKNADDFLGMNSLVSARFPKELEDLLFHIAKDENYYTSWAEERIHQQDLYIKTFFQEETCARKGTEIIAEELFKSVGNSIAIKRIKEKHIKTG